MKYALWIVLAVLVLGGGWYFMSMNPIAPSSAPTTSAAAAGSADTSASVQINTPPSMSATVTYASGGFSPASVTIKKGGSVTFVNTSGQRMWVASNPHPTHEGYSGTTKNQHCPDTAGVAFDQCSVGASYTFTFQKTGTWAYHNHAIDEDSGVVTVVQ